MGLKDGTLADLIPRNDETPHFNTAGIVCTHMLRALDFLASKRIIHRDLKPENILYTTVNGEFHLQLGDFGLSNRQEAAATHAGSMLYQAPEFFLGGSQSPKADIWSLFVTIMWTLNTYKLRQIARNRHAFVGIHVLWDKITEAASQPEYAKFQAMARTDPNTRASAAQMLVALFNGKGLTTPRRQIPDIVSLVPAVTPVSPVTAQLPVPGVGNPEPSPAARLRGQAPTRSPALRLNPPAPPVPTIRLPGNGNLKNQPDGPSPLLPAFPAYQRGRRPGLRDLQLQPRGLGQQAPVGHGRASGRRRHAVRLWTSSILKRRRARRTRESRVARGVIGCLARFRLTVIWAGLFNIKSRFGGLVRFIAGYPTVGWLAAFETIPCDTSLL